MLHLLFSLTILFSVAILLFIALQIAVKRYMVKHPPTDVIMTRPLETVYMRRWIVWPKIDTKKNTWDPKHKFAIIINQFMGTDLDPPHNHMGWSFSIALDGIGFEKTDDRESILSPPSIRIRSPKMKHSIDSSSYFPLVTLFIAQLDPDAKWGFWEDGQFTEAKNFKGTKYFKH